MHRNRRGRPCGGWPCSCRHIRLGLHLRPLRPLPPHLLHLRQAFWHARLVTCGCGHACRRKQVRSRSAWRRRAWRHWSWTRRGRCRRTIASTLCLQLIQRRLSFRTQTPLLLRPASGWRRWRRHPAVTHGVTAHVGSRSRAHVADVRGPHNESLACCRRGVTRLHHGDDATADGLPVHVQSARTRTAVDPALRRWRNTRAPVPEC